MHSTHKIHAFLFVRSGTRQAKKVRTMKRVTSAMLEKLRKVLRNYLRKLY